MTKHIILIFVIVLGLTTIYIGGCSSGGDPVGTGASDPTQPIPIPDDGKIPDPPKNVTALAGDQEAVVSWDKVFSAVGYRIYQSDDGVTFIRLTGSSSLSGLTTRLTGLTNGRTYYFGVTAIDERNNESGIAYVGGTPTAYPVIPMPPPAVPNETPDTINTAKWTPGDRKVMLEWDPVSADRWTHYTLERYVKFSPLVVVEVDDFEYVFDLPFYPEPHELDKYPDKEDNIPIKITDFDYSEGTFIDGFTIPARPYYIDRGVFPYGLPPNYTPLGLVDGDIWYEYKLKAWNGSYSSEYVSPVSTCTPETYECFEFVTPADDPPHSPVLLAVVLVPNTSGDGFWAQAEWLQPEPPEGSDTRNYVVSATKLGASGYNVKFLVEGAYTHGASSVYFLDKSITAGGSYQYQIFAQDYMAQFSGGSNSMGITVPGETEPPPTT